MPLHPQVRAVIARRQASVPAPGPDDTLADARRRFMTTWREPGPEVYSVEDMEIEGPGGPIPIRIYRPGAAAVYPALVSFHGGGFVFGGIDSYDGNARRLATAADCAVVVVDYRLAPEHPFPAAPDDAFTAVNWVAERGADHGLDPRRIAVGGDSAGANLSTVVCLMGRDRGGPELRLQILMCPALHPDWQPPIHDPEETPPMQKDWWWSKYLADPADAADPYAVPLMAEDLRGLPPALVVTAEYDELLGEGEAYARRLQEAGVATTYRRYPGMWHIFHMYPGHIDLAKDAVAEEVRALRGALGT